MGGVCEGGVCAALRLEIIIENECVIKRILQLQKLKGIFSEDE